MKKLIFILVICMFSQIPDLKAQLQPGECGILFTYDATGSLIKREFICNNTGGVMSKASTENNIYQKDSASEDIVKINALMPNPTSGKFTVRLAKVLNNETVSLMDENGKVIQSGRKSGIELNFDISSFPAGIYFLKIASNGKMISLKVIKQ